MEDPFIRLSHNYFSVLSHTAERLCDCHHTISFLLFFLSLLHYSHTTPVNDQLPLLIGQLEKQSGRSIARISGGKKLCVVWWRCSYMPRQLQQSFMLLRQCSNVWRCYSGLLLSHCDFSKFLNFITKEQLKMLCTCLEGL